MQWKRWKRRSAAQRTDSTHAWNRRARDGHGILNIRAQSMADADPKDASKVGIVAIMADGGAI